MGDWKPYILWILIWGIIIIFFWWVVSLVNYLNKNNNDLQKYENVSKNCTGTWLVVVHNDRYYPEADYYVCINKWEYCRNECKKTFNDLNDTWGSNTANKTDLWSWINQCIDTCLKTTN